MLNTLHGHTYRYDAQGNVVHKHSAASASGTGSPSSELALEYDADNRLRRSVRIEHLTRHTADYFYDAFSRRIAKRVVAEVWQGNQQFEYSTATTTVFVWDGDVLAQELSCDDTITYLCEPDSFVPMTRIASRGGYRSVVDAPAPMTQLLLNMYGNNAVLPVADTKDFRHIYIRHVKHWMLTRLAKEGERAKLETADCFAEEEHQTAWQQCQADAEALALGDRIDYYNCDHLGAAKELVDEQGKVIWSPRTRVWGDAVTNANVFVDGVTRNLPPQPIRFQGQYEDAESGLFYNRYRYYDPSAAKYLTQDPISLAGGLNAYIYAPNPTGWIDQLGLSKTCSSSLLCDPCIGKNPAAEAMATQGTLTNPSNPYSGVDVYINRTLKARTILYSLSPGAPPGFAVTNHTLLKANGDIVKYHDLTQVTPGVDASGHPRQMRKLVQAFRVNEDICVAESVAKNNPQFGKGGATQYYVSPSDIGKLTPGKKRAI
jgi:RHS repeat-associated protein